MKSKYIISTIFLASIASADIGTTQMWQLDSKTTNYPYINIANEIYRSDVIKKEKKGNSGTTAVKNLTF